MSSKTPQSAGKIVVECPHCGFRQLESPFGKSTYCRKCSEHYELGKPEVSPRGGASSLLSKIGDLFTRQKTRTVTCFRCGSRQIVSGSARSSLCPSCSTYIDLSDFKIAAAYSRIIETQGRVIIGPKADVTSTKIACSDAQINGKMRGALLSTGTVHLNFKGKLHGALEANHLIVEKRAEIEMLRPVKASSVEICGKVSAHMNVDGPVVIKKRGSLEGSLQAKSITIEKGGVFRGELKIGKQELTQPDLIPME